MRDLEPRRLPGRALGLAGSFPLDAMPPYKTQVENHEHAGLLPLGLEQQA